MGIKRKKKEKLSWWERRKKQKRKERFFKEIIERNEYKPFLNEVSKSLAALVKQNPDDTLFLNIMEAEAKKWLDEAPEINQASFKTGVCFGLLVYCKLKNIPLFKEPYVV